tara:strand:- start:3104 stop:3907 length:804 start_codon:yes stop_codon:yes gene_type:complete
MAKSKDKTEAVVEQPTVIREPAVKKRAGDIKAKHESRFYFLKGNRSPLTCRIPSRVLIWDEESGHERSAQYTRNQKTIWVDEFKGQVRPSAIVFQNGGLHVGPNLQTLQYFLERHPMNGSIFSRKDNVKTAVDQVAYIEMEIAALNAAQSMDIDMAEAIMRVEIGSKVSKMTSKELKRDLLLFARRNANLFLELANDDNVVLRNFGIRATEMSVIRLSQDQRTFSWAANDRKLFTVPFDEHPYTALAHWFKTDEGMEIYSSIEKRLK